MRVSENHSESYERALEKKAGNCLTKICKNYQYQRLFKTFSHCKYFAVWASTNSFVIGQRVSLKSAKLVSTFIETSSRIHFQCEENYKIRKLIYRRSPTGGTDMIK
jgi:hypothetical protein